MAVVGYMYGWAIKILATVLSVTLIISLAAVVIGVREQEFGYLSQRLKELDSLTIVNQPIG